MSRFAQAFVLIMLVGAMPAVADEATVTEVSVVPQSEHFWFLKFLPDGSVHAQYGSNFGDNGWMPAGTVDFDALVRAIQRLRSDEPVEGGTQAALHEKGKQSATAFYLRDDTLLRYLVDAFQDQWRSGLIVDEAAEPAGSDSRFAELLRLRPIYMDERPGDGDEE